MGGAPASDLNLDPLVEEYDGAELRLRRSLQLQEDTLQGQTAATELAAMRAALLAAVTEANRLGDLLLDTLRELDDMDTDRRLQPAR